MEDISDICENTPPSDAKKSNKPLMEKRRRARINACLSQLKSLVLEAMKKDTSRYSKLEKADILEMTVKHLRNIQRQQMNSAINTDPTVISKYRAGFNECLKEVNNYVHNINGINEDTKLRLLNHLAGCMQTPSLNIPQNEMVSSAQVFQIQNNAQMSPNNSQSVFRIAPATTLVAARPTNSVQLIPGTLPNGEVAFFVPNNVQTNNYLPNNTQNFINNGVNNQNGFVSTNAQNNIMPNNAQNCYMPNNMNNPVSIVSTTCNTDSRQFYNQSTCSINVSPQMASEAPSPNYSPTLNVTAAQDSHIYQPRVVDIAPNSKVQAFKQKHMPLRADNSMKREETMWRPW